MDEIHRRNIRASSHKIKSMMPLPNSEIIIYQNQQGSIKVDVRLEDETVWLTQAQMATLFGKRRTTITEHIGNVFKEGELDEEVVCRNFRHTTQHGAMIGKTNKVTFEQAVLNLIQAE